MPKLIFQIKPEDWEKSLSYDPEAFTNGIFKQLTNCNPFAKKGALFPTPAITELGSGTINTSKTIRVILPVYVSALPQFYVFADDGKCYITDGANVTDVSAQIASGTYTARAAGIWKGGIVYVKDTEARFNAIPLASGSDVQVLTGLTTGPHPFCVAADGYGYIGNGVNVAKLTSSAGTAGNATSVAASLETGFIVRDLVNDGRYLVWFADNASTKFAGGQKNRCIVAYWDLAKSTFDQIFEFEDSYIAGAEIIGSGAIKFITPSGIYVTNAATRPQLVVPFGNLNTILPSEVPSDHNCMTVLSNTFLLWGSQKATGNDAVYAHGTNIPGKAERLFQPYTATSNPISALGSNNNDTLVAVGNGSSVKLYSLTASATYNTSVANITGVTLPQTFSFHHARVVLRYPMSAGNSVSLKLLNSPSSETSSTGAKTVKASETKTNSTDPGEKNLVFDHTSAGDGSDVDSFDDLSDIELTTNVPIKLLQIYGDPKDERSTHG